MMVLRSPESRFANLSDYPFAPNTGGRLEGRGKGVRVMRQSSPPALEVRKRWIFRSARIRGEYQVLRANLGQS